MQFPGCLTSRSVGDGTAPDLGASNRGFVASLTGVDLNEPSEAEMYAWKGIYSSIHRLNLNFQITHFYKLTGQILAWPAAEDVFVNVCNCPAVAAAPRAPSSRRMFGLGFRV